MPLLFPQILHSSVLSHLPKGPYYPVHDISCHPLLIFKDFLFNSRRDLVNTPDGIEHPRIPYIWKNLGQNRYQCLSIVTHVDVSPDVAYELRFATSKGGQDSEH